MMRPPGRTARTIVRTMASGSGDVLEQEARVRHVEARPLVVFERRRVDAALPEIEQRSPLRPPTPAPIASRNLRLAALDADDRRPVARAIARENWPSPAPKSITRSPAASRASASDASFSSPFSRVSRCCSSAPVPWM